MNNSPFLIEVDQIYLDNKSGMIFLVTKVTPCRKSKLEHYDEVLGYAINSNIKTPVLAAYSENGQFTDILGRYTYLRDASDAELAWRNIDLKSNVKT